MADGALQSAHVITERNYHASRQAPIDCCRAGAARENMPRGTARASVIDAARLAHDCRLFSTPISSTRRYDDISTTR